MCKSIGHRPLRGRCPKSIITVKISMFESLTTKVNGQNVNQGLKITKILKKPVFLVF